MNSQGRSSNSLSQFAQNNADYTAAGTPTTIFRSLSQTDEVEE